MACTLRHALIVIGFVLLLPGGAQAQRQIVTDHFYIYFNSNAEHTAKRIADVAEEVFDALASSFDFYDSFSRIHILVHDDRDFANGFANYYQNRVEIWASDLDFPHLRGTHDWIKLVVTHELAHIVSLKVASKGLFNAVIIQSGQYDRNPDFAIALPWLHLVAPAWYIEGIAQLVDEQIGYETWDTHRDMLLRMATLENDLLSYSQMGVFSHDSIHSEMIYNQGYGLLRYIRDRYGAGKAEALNKHVGYLRFDPAIKKVLGISAKSLFREWKQYLRQHYGARAHRIAETRLGPDQPEGWDTTAVVQDEDLTRLMQRIDTRFEGELLIDGGTFDLQPVYSPDGTKLAYLSNKGSDFAITTIQIMDLTTGKRTNTRERATTSISWTPDSRSIVYGRRGGAYYDVYRYDMDEKKGHRLSANLRVRDPAVSPDGATIAFIRNQDGTTNIGLMNSNGTNVRYLTNNNDGTIYYTPRWSPDGRQLVFCVFRGNDRDIGIIDVDSPTFVRVGGKKPAKEDTLAFADSTRFTPLIHSDADERDPAWLPDGSGLVFSSDREGIFNLYEYAFTTGEARRRSDVLGGAFQADVSPDGAHIVYAGYHADNYSLYTLDRTTAPNEPVSTPAVARDYNGILRDGSISDTYTVSGVPRRLSVSGIIPVIGISQTFIGNEFGLNSVSLGAQVSIDDVLGRDRIFLSGSVGLNLRHRIDPNLEGTIVYERQLPPILSKNRTLAPSVYGVYDRSILHNLRKRTLIFRDTSQVDVVVELTNGVIDTVAGTQLTDETFQSRDAFKFDFNTYAIGLRLPLTGRQTLLMEHARRTYREGFDSGGPDRLKRQLFVGAQLVASLDTTITFSGRLLDDAKFFTSNTTLFYWNYRTLTPAIDSSINPSGGRDIALWYRRIGSTVTDSLSSPTDRIIDGQVVPIQPDPDQFSLLTPVRSRMNINELGLSWTEFIPLPISRHTLSLSTLIRYQDKRLRGSAEGGGFYWPLRIYLGGLGSLSGYPYFTMSGSKAALWRGAYTFPVFAPIHRRFLFLYLDRMYLSGFWEAGATWNFDALTVKSLRSSRVLHNVGVQLKMQVFSFYRIPMIVYAQAAVPLTDITERSRQNLGLSPGRDIDNVRFYFGLGFF